MENEEGKEEEEEDEGVEQEKVVSLYDWWSTENSTHYTWSR